MVFENISPVMGFENLAFKFPPDKVFENISPVMVFENFSQYGVQKFYLYISPRYGA